MNKFLIYSYPNSFLKVVEQTIPLSINMPYNNDVMMKNINLLNG